MDYLPREVLYLGPNTRVFAAVHPQSGEALALKLAREEAPSEHRLDKLRHEHALLCELEMPGVIRVVDLQPQGAGLALVMERWGAGSLDKVLAQGPLPVETALRLGAALSSVLGQVHRRGIIHRDVKPSNTLADKDLREVRLIDFGLAVRRGTYVSEKSAPEQLAGTLAFMAPEQTGRMGRGVDSRADLYSLGVTLYQMLTGALPFETSDALSLVHAQIARTPPPPHERAPGQGVPEAVSAIVMKLMEKNLEARYQTAEGVIFDLERTAKEWHERGAVAPFELGTHDWANRVRKASRLFGREREVAELEGALGRAASGAAELLLVAGPSGVGKSALVGAVRAKVRECNAIFAPGKLDQLQRGTPYFALSQAFRSIVRRRLADPAPQLAWWKQAW